MSGEPVKWFVSFEWEQNGEGPRSIVLDSEAQYLYQQVFCPAWRGHAGWSAFGWAARGERMIELTVEFLGKEAKAFAASESSHDEPARFGVTDGKAVGTYFEHKFQAHLGAKYAYEAGSSAKGIDFPGLSVDMKVTSIRQPQSSCPYKSARQKIYGLGYSLLVFVYEKTDDPGGATGRLNIQHVVLVEAAHTADFQMTTGLLDILNNYFYF